MPSDPPLSFAALARTAQNPEQGGYPYQLRGADLDTNFVFACEDFDAESFDETTTSGNGGNIKRQIALKIKIPDFPKSGTFVLGAVNGALSWIATEEC